jgi:hypothetical protein
MGDFYNISGLEYFMKLSAILLNMIGFFMNICMIELGYW